jgi:putative hydrolase of the HAD superfamily
VIIYKPFGKIQAMTFDLDDTLYNNWPYIIEAEKSLLSYIASKYPDAKELDKSDWQQFKREALSVNPALFSDMGVLRQQVLTKGLANSGYAGDELDSAVTDCFNWFYYERSNFKVEQHIVDVLTQLSEAMPLIAITNGNVNLEQIGIGHCFQRVLKASLSSPMKPHPFMFEEAISELSAQLEITPKEILHVGDNLEKDVLGATNVGMATAWHACDRPMNLSHEKVQVLPNVEIQDLNELLTLI